MGKQRYSWCLYVLINVLSSNVLDPFFPSWIVLLFNLQGLYYVQRSQLLYEHLWSIKFKCPICYEELAERRGFTRGGLVSQPQVISQGEPSLKIFLSYSLYHQQLSGGSESFVKFGPPVPEIIRNKQKGTTFKNRILL